MQIQTYMYVYVYQFFLSFLNYLMKNIFVQRKMILHYILTLSPNLDTQVTVTKRCHRSQEEQTKGSLIVPFQSNQTSDKKIKSAFLEDSGSSFLLTWRINIILSI